MFVVQRNSREVLLFGSDPEIRQGSGIGPTVKTFYNPYDRYCNVQAQIGDALAIGKWTQSVLHRAEIFSS